MNSRWWRLFDRTLYQLRWIGPPAYLGLALYMGWIGIEFISDATLSTQLLGWGFLAIGLWSLRQSYKEFREARDAEPPAWLPDLPDPDQADRPAWRHPLTPELREQLLTTFALLVAAGILDPDEVPDDEIVECAEHMDVFEDMDIYSVMRVLEMLGDERDPPLRHLAFFTTHAEFYEDDAFGIVREFARISGYDGPLRQIRCDMTGDWQSPSLNPVPNAVIEFEMGKARYSLPFTTYAKYLPDGLIEQLAPIFAPPESAGRFYVSWVVDDMDITFTTPAKIDEFNAALGPEPSWVPI
ncbi:hypothetical protein [Mycolicibacterium peregrinum]|uniref:Uncharacterized protein n=1 Tax=Mycolicibacterium peregrinum TaxID=43304 RepID=A0A1A0W9L2_MYCPR|nr:hypothetical protein [Mycolicibacterium peregrinum]OBB93384.1 hypothetical protein A5779_21045 [Mycolicibacterium peregrinum]